MEDFFGWGCFFFHAKTAVRQQRDTSGKYLGPEVEQWKEKQVREAKPYDDKESTVDRMLGFDRMGLYLAAAIKRSEDNIQGPND